AVPSRTLTVRGRGRGRDRIRGRRGRAGLLLLLSFGVFLLDPGLLAVADQPPQHPRLVDADDDVVGRVEDRRIVDQLARGSLSAVELLADRVEALGEAVQVPGELPAELLVAQQDRQRAVALLELADDGRQRRRRRGQVVEEPVDLLLPFGVRDQRRQRSGVVRQR